MTDPIVYATKAGEQDASTLLWNGGYVLPAAGNFILGFIVLIMGQTIARRMKTGQKIRWIDRAVQYANASSVTVMALAFLFFAIGCALVYSGLFGPANMMSLHFDPLAAGMGDIKQWFVQNALPKIGKSQYNFFHWIFPVIAVLLTQPIVLAATAYFNGFEDNGANTLVVTGLITTVLHVLTYVHPNTTGWYLYMVGALALTFLDAWMIYGGREAAGAPTMIAPGIPIIYEAAILIILAVGSYSSQLYTMDVTYIWLQVVLTTLCIVFSAFFTWGGYYKVARATKDEATANKKAGASAKKATFTSN